MPLHINSTAKLHIIFLLASSFAKKNYGKGKILTYLCSRALRSTLHRRSRLCRVLHLSCGKFSFKIAVDVNRTLEIESHKKSTDYLPLPSALWKIVSAFREIVSAFRAKVSAFSLRRQASAIQEVTTGAILCYLYSFHALMPMPSRPTLQKACMKADASLELVMSGTLRSMAARLIL